MFILDETLEVLDPLRQSRAKENYCIALSIIIIQWNPDNVHVDNFYFRLIRTNLPVPRINFRYFALLILGNPDISYPLKFYEKLCNLLYA